MICPNCGASNSTRATFCRRCHQRLPVAGLAAGVTYPRRRAVASGGGRLPIIAALFLALTGLIIGAMLVAFARPSGSNGPIAAITPSPSPQLSQPVYSPEETPTPSPPPIETFSGLPTPFPSLSPLPTDSGLLSPPPSIILPTPTPTPTTVGPTPTPTATPTRTPRPTPTPTNKPTPTPTNNPTPTPTPTPLGYTCSGVSGNPSQSTVVGTGNSDKTAHNWCLETATFRVVGPNYGSADLLVNGRRVASYSCAYDVSLPVCQDQTVTIAHAPRLALAGVTISWQPTACTDPTGTPCSNDQFQVTIQVGYEPAIKQ